MAYTGQVQFEVSILPLILLELVLNVNLPINFLESSTAASRHQKYNSTANKSDLKDLVILKRINSRRSQCA